MAIITRAIGYAAGALNGHFFGSVSSLLGNDQLDLSSVQDTYQAVKGNFDGEIDTTKLVEGANRGMVAALDDEYTVYMNKKE